MLSRWWPQTIFLSSSFLTDFSLVLHFPGALVTSCTVRRYLQPVQVVQVIQLLHMANPYVLYKKIYFVS